MIHFTLEYTDIKKKKRQPIHIIIFANTLLILTTLSFVYYSPVLNKYISIPFRVEGKKTIGILKRNMQH